jgi:hypothetical protein
MLAWLVPTLQDVQIDVGQVLLNTVLRVLLPLLVSAFRVLVCMVCSQLIMDFRRDTLESFSSSCLHGMFSIDNGLLARYTVVKLSENCVTDLSEVELI